MIKSVRAVWSYH